jgi:hypothetical protein
MHHADSHWSSASAQTAKGEDGVHARKARGERPIGSRTALAAAPKGAHLRRWPPLPLRRVLVGAGTSSAQGHPVSATLDGVCERRL